MQNGRHRLHQRQHRPHTKLKSYKLGLIAQSQGHATNQLRSQVVQNRANHTQQSKDHSVDHSKIVVTKAT